MTYNVHRCRGLDRRWSPARIARVIDICRPDIVALQELDVGRVRSGQVDQAQTIARHLAMDVHFFPALKVLDELYGDAVLSRWPMRLKKAEGLPGYPRIRGLEPRGALWAEIEVASMRVQLINTHLGILGAERRKQVAALLGPDWLGHADCTPPAVLVGDFNATPQSRSYAALRRRLRDVQRSQAGGRNNATFPTRYPTLALDHIFVSADIQVIDSFAVRSALARVASDHLPLMAELRLPPRQIETRDLRHARQVEVQ